MSDTELSALTAVVNAETAMREGTNSQREIQQLSMAYTEDEAWPSLERLTAELAKRGVV